MARFVAFAAAAFPPFWNLVVNGQNTIIPLLAFFLAWRALESNRRVARRARARPVVLQATVRPRARGCRARRRRVGHARGPRGGGGSASRNRGRDDRGVIAGRLRRVHARGDRGRVSDRARSVRAAFDPIACAAGARLVGDAAVAGRQRRRSRAHGPSLAQRAPMSWCAWACSCSRRCSSARISLRTMRRCCRSAALDWGVGAADAAR